MVLPFPSQEYICNFFNPQKIQVTYQYRNTSQIACILIIARAGHCCQMLWYTGFDSATGFFWCLQICNGYPTKSDSTKTCTNSNKSVSMTWLWYGRLICISDGAKNQKNNSAICTYCVVQDFTMALSAVRKVPNDQSAVFCPFEILLISWCDDGLKHWQIL